MKPRLLRTLVAAFALVALSPILKAQAPPIRIMPLGDSITDGSAFDSPDGSGGYRGPLLTLLANNGYTVDSVGSTTVNSGLLAEKEHDGHSGWRIDQLDSNIAGWFDAIQDPDVVLMHIGTNDFGQNFSTATAIDRLDALILKIATLRPYAHIIVTNLMERGEPQNSAIQAQFNPSVQGVVDAHALAGRRVTFLDMRAAVPLSDMPDQLHPDQNGYNKMAAAWLPAIQAVISPEGDSAPPFLARASGDLGLTQVRVRFSKPVGDSAADPANFSIDGGLSVTAAELDATKRIVTLTTTPQTGNTEYTITVNGVQDRISPVPNAIAADSTVGFTAAIPRGFANHVPESADYSLVYSIDLPNDANYASVSPQYAIDTHHLVGPFDRVAYYVELQTALGGLQYAWVSADAFTDDAGKIGIPSSSTGAIFQQGLTNMNIVSNVAGVSTGNGIAGQIEFWPTNYSAPNGAGVTGASGALYDFGDTRTETGRYGSMQIHNVAAAQTVFAFNNWGSAKTPTDPAQNIDLGIGNGTGENPDWTFAQNGANYTIKSIQVLVRRTGDLAAPVAQSARATAGRTRVMVEFDEPVVASSVLSSQFTLSHGVGVLGVTVLEDARLVEITTTLQPAATPLTLTLTGIRDTSPNANLIAPGTTVNVGDPVLPAEVVTNVGAASNGYQLVYSYDLSPTGDLNGTRKSFRYDDSSATGTFTKIAYYLELQQPGQPSRFVWTSMDAFTANRAKTGIPTLASGAAYQRSVSNLDILSNAPGVTTGSAITTGSLEFWPDTYTQPNGAAIPGASASTYDFGDTRTANGSYYGSMQLHNRAATQTVFAVNHFGSDGFTLEAGIGNSGGADPDWTFTENANVYSKRILHVLVLPGITTPPDVTAKVPAAADYQLLATVNLPALGNLSGGAGSPGYAFDYRTEVGPYRRVAYLLELKKTTDPQTSYIWTAMDAFSPIASRVCVPNTASGAFFQQNVANLDVVSNVAGIVNGTGIATGNIEFWPGNYNGTNPTNVPGASNSAFDFGDGGAGAGAGYGSMQVHNHGAGQVLFAINNWGASNNIANKLCLGIGNQPTGEPDWTFAQNAETWNETRVLRIFVLPGDTDVTGPVITKVTASTGLDGVAVTFSEPVADPAAVPANFTVSGGVTVTGATLSADKKTIVLSTSAQVSGTAYTLGATGILDRSPAGNPIAPGTSAPFTAFTPPAALAAVAETAGYQLVYQLDIPVASPRWNFNAVPYTVDQTKFGEFGFDRVAYLMELDSNWIYTSFDAFASSITKIGIPTAGVTATPFQRTVSNLNVASNVPSIYPDSALRSGLTGGNIEFWGGNYDPGNALGIPNASGSTRDWGDTMTAGGHGTFQVHDHANSRVLFAMNNWGSNQGAGQNVELGIGTRPTADPDWTFASNAGSYTTRRLYVLARPSIGEPTGPAPQILSQPTSRAVAAGASTTLSVQVAGTAPVSYQWRFEGGELPGETLPWLDLSGFSPEQAGAYDVVVSSATGVTITSATATVSLAVVVEPFAAFLTQYGLTNPEDDSDQDGVSALLEWFLGGVPTDTDSSILPDGEVTAPGTFVVTFQMPESVGTATWSVESGSDLDDWTTAVHGENGVSITTGAAAEGYLPVTVTFTGTPAPFFTRLVVVAPE